MNKKTRWMLKAPVVRENGLERMNSLVASTSLRRLPISSIHPHAAYKTADAVQSRQPGSGFVCQGRWNSVFTRSGVSQGWINNSDPSSRMAVGVFHKCALRGATDKTSILNRGQGESTPIAEMTNWRTDLNKQANSMQTFIRYMSYLLLSIHEEIKF